MMIEIISAYSFNFNVIQITLLARHTRQLQNKHFLAKRKCSECIIKIYESRRSREENGIKVHFNWLV